MNDNIRKEVAELLGDDISGHGTDHIDRVVSLSLKFAEAEGADAEITELIALLHDVDDYKLFGTAGAVDLPNARRILENANIDVRIQENVLSEISRIGFNKALNGIRPESLEGKIVSDADMCDALGVNGVIRAYRYSIKDGKPFFDRKSFPIENMTPQIYKTHDADSTVCHIFEKILKLKDMMLTDAGRAEALSRHEIVILILHHLFEEENADEWIEYLNKKHG